MIMKTAMVGCALNEIVVGIALWMVMLQAWHIQALDNGLGDLPPMGWNSWNLAGCHINESFFRATVDDLAANGFREAGYEYINLDDCWMSTKRDADGNLQWDPVAFPTGDTLGDYVHSKGFKFGMYLSAGPKTCSLNTCSHSTDPNCKVNRTATGWGSFSSDGSVEARDALWIAKQGADYLKYDGVCGGDYEMPLLNGTFSVLDWEQVVVSKMGKALNATGRPIWYQYGSPYVWSRHGGPMSGLQWITKNASLGGLNSYRSGFDMSDSWGNVGEQIGNTAKYNRGINTDDCDGYCPWPDADCLEIGNNLTRINVVQSQSYFSWYSIANAPLIMSTRIDTLNPGLKAILMNHEVIAINQDYAGVKGQPVSSPFSKSGLVWGKPLSGRNGSAAFLLNNQNCQTSSPCFNGTVFFNDLGYYSSTNASVRDVVTGKDVGWFVGSYTALLGQDESRLLKITPCPTCWPDESQPSSRMQGIY